MRNTNIFRYLLLFIGLPIWSIFICPVAVTAETDVEVIKEQINQIKSDSTFLWAESTQTAEEQAYQRASAELVWNINITREELGLSAISAQQILSEAHTLSHGRGSYYRVFVYVPLSVSLPESDTSSINVASGNESVYEMDSVCVESEIDSVYVNDSIVEACCSEKDVNADINNNLAEAIMVLRYVSMIDDAQHVLQQLQKDQAITSFGPVQKMSDTDGHVYLLVYNRTERTVLGLVEGRDGQFRNLSSNKVVDLKRDYPGCGALWFK